MSRNVSGGDSGSMSCTRPSRLAASSRKRSRRSPPSAAPADEPAGAASSNTAITSTRRPARNPRIGRPGIGLWYNSRVRSPAVPVAVLLAGGRLAGDLEIIAFKAAGVSTLRLFRPVLAAALVVTAVTAAITLVINPIANQEFQRQLFKILQARATSGLAERVFNPTFGDVIIYVEDVSASQVALRGLLVSDERDNKISRIITAREGRLLTDEENRRITLRLINGAVSEADVLPAAPAVPAATVGSSPPTGGAASAARYRLTNFSIYDMSLAVDSPLRSAPRVEKPEKDLSLPALHDRLEELKDDRAGRTPYLVEWHKRLAFPVAA